MNEKLVCPNASKRQVPPKDGATMDEACEGCPALLRQVDERGSLAFYCLVYHNRFRSAGAAIPLTTKPPTRATRPRDWPERPASPAG
jgi:hypothetical protein